MLQAIHSRRFYGEGWIEAEMVVNTQCCSKAPRPLASTNDEIRCSTYDYGERLEQLANVSRSWYDGIVG